MSIAVIAGLGNPGLKYRNTRHNIGFDLVDRFAAVVGGSWRSEARLEAEISAVRAGDHKLLLAKPQTYMNDSGRALGAILRYYKASPDSLLVVYDDITLELGRAKLSAKGSAAGHNGVQNLIETIGPVFLRYRVGIGAKPHKEMDLADFVLSRFKPAEKALLDQKMPTYMDHLRLIIDKDKETAFNNINQRKPTSHDSSHNEQL